MSRTRIVKGNITKIIGGNYKLYSKDNIENIGSKVIQVGKEDGVSYGEPEPPPIIGKKIVNIYWTYGKDNTPIIDDSKFFVDMNLVVETRNYEEGESVNITIKSDDGEPIVEGLSELTLSGTVDRDGIVIFKEPLKNYTLELMKEEEGETKNI